MKFDRDCHWGKINCQAAVDPDTSVIYRWTDYQPAGRLFNGRLMRCSECGTDNGARRPCCNG